jgi:hypothetical protein
MKHSERITPVAAAVSAIATLACCLPLGFAGAAATASLSMILDALRPWLLGLAVCLAGIGMYQMYGSGGTCRRRRRTSVVLVWLSAVVVVLVIVFPQLVAGVLADLLS